MPRRSAHRPQGSPSCSLQRVNCLLPAGLAALSLGPRLRLCQCPSSWPPLARLTLFSMGTSAQVSWRHGSSSLRAQPLSAWLTSVFRTQRPACHSRSSSAVENKSGLKGKEQQPQQPQLSSPGVSSHSCYYSFSTPPKHCSHLGLRPHIPPLRPVGLPHPPVTRPCARPRSAKTSPPGSSIQRTHLTPHLP